MSRFLQIFWVFFKIGAFTLGGGYAMVPLMKQQVVDVHKWVEEEDIVDVFSVAQSIPGAIAINAAVYIGYKIAGIKGAIVSGIGVILPSFISILAIYYAISGHLENKYVKNAFLGVRAGIIGLVLNSGVSLWKRGVKGPLDIVLCVGAALVIALLGVNVAWLILLGLVIGLFYFFRAYVK